MGSYNGDVYRRLHFSAILKTRFLTMINDNLHRQCIVACIWDFDKTLINGYMEAPIFKRYGIDEGTFWKEVGALPDIYLKRGIRVSPDTVYLNHLLSHVRDGSMKGLNNDVLRELGAELEFYPGLPEFLRELKESVRSQPSFATHGIEVEHYIISAGLSEMIQGSAIAPYVDGIFGCEFIENPLPPGFSNQNDFGLEEVREISQIGTVVDHTTKTRFIFKINKGSNKNPDIDVNAKVLPEDRRIPIDNMIYIADGPSDTPVFSVIRNNGGRTYAVYNPNVPGEFIQNDKLLQTDRIDAYGPADYTPSSSTYMWIKMHLDNICERIVKEREYVLSSRVTGPPRHLHNKEDAPGEPERLRQETFLE